MSDKENQRQGHQQTHEQKEKQRSVHQKAQQQILQQAKNRSKQLNKNNKGPKGALFLCLISSWILFIIPGLEGLIIIGCIFSFAALVLSIVCITKGNVVIGVFGLILTLLGSPLVFFIGRRLIDIAFGVK